MTPAQASGRYDFVEDVPIQGPTDPGMRAASCWWVQNMLPVKDPACVDCKGPVPLWAKNPTAWGGGWPQYGGNGGPNCGRGEPEPVRYGSRQVAGFSLDAANDVPRDVPRGWSVAGWQDGGSLATNGSRPPRGWSVARWQDDGSLAATGDPTATLTSDQRAWVQSTLNTLNTNIGQATGTSCPGWQDAGTNLAAAVGCFQIWANANGKASLRNDGVLDEDTLCALLSVAAAHPYDFPTSFPNMGRRCYGGASPTASPAVPPPPPMPAAAAAVPPPPPMPTAAVAVAPPPPPQAPMRPPVPPPPPPVTASMIPDSVKKYGPMVAIGVASAIAVGGIVYTASKRKR